jgi:hypothetical protein
MARTRSTRITITTERVRAGSASVERATRSDAAAIEHVRVDLRRLHACVSHEFLHRADVRAGIEHVRGEAVAEGVARGRFLDARIA